MEGGRIMKLAGKEVMYGDILTNTQKNYLQQRVSALARLLHGRGYDVKMNTSVSTDSIYLEVNEIKISFRNHPSRGKHYSVIISSFPNWAEAKDYVLKNIIPRCTTPEKLKHNFLGDVNVSKVTQTEVKNPSQTSDKETPNLDEEALNYIKAIEENTKVMLNSIKKVPKNTQNNGNLIHVENLMRNTQRNINKLKVTVG